MCILNGRSGLPGDVGSFTCMTHNGQSVVDMMLTSYQNVKYITEFKVKHYNEHSNHTPIQFSLKIGYSKESHVDMEMVVHRWNGESKDQSYRIHELYREKTVDEKVKLFYRLAERKSRH